MKRHAIIGAYASDKLLITDFDVQRTNERTLQQSKTRKLVGNNRQNLRITLEGQLRCTTFEELDTEVDALLDALNNREINLLIGATPDRFYRVSWSGSSLARRGGAGGPHLPVSLDFDVLDEGAIVGLPVSYGAVQVPGITGKINQSGLMDSEPTLINQRTFFAKGSRGNVLWNTIDDTGIALYEEGGQAFAFFWLNGAFYKSVILPVQSEYHLGLVFGDDKTTLYVDGRAYVFNVSYSAYNWKFLQENAFYGAFPFEGSDAFMGFLATQGKDSIMKARVVDEATEYVLYSGMDNTPVSVHAKLTSVAQSRINLGDFGASFTGQNADWVIFNGITNDITTNRLTILDGMGYNNRFTLLPRLKKGRNAFNIEAGNASYVLMWRDMVR